MLGIQDPLVWLAYLLCIASAVLCIVYGAINWNRNDDSVSKEDARWANKEKKIEEEL